MREIKCPKCGNVFSVDEADYAAIVTQVRNAEFDAEIQRRMNEVQERHKTEQELATEKAATLSITIYVFFRIAIPPGVCVPFHQTQDLRKHTAAEQTRNVVFTTGGLNASSIQIARASINKAN